MMHVLLVDTDPEHSASLVETLERAGHSVDVLDDGLKAFGYIKYIVTRGRPLDVVVADIVLPQLSGLELLERLKEARLHVPVILMSQANDEGEQIAALRRGCSDIVQKPVGDKHLLRLVDKAAASPNSFFFDATQF